MQAVPRPSRLPWLLAAILLAVALAGVWTFVARRQLSAAVVAEASAHLDYARKAFTIATDRQQAELQSHCRVLVEDPRLKSTLATEGIDEATVADILDDLAKLRGSGFLLVLSPEGRVFAQSGAAELHGLDLSESSVVKKARTETNAVAGAWVLAGRVMDLSTKAIRFGDNVIGFLVVGQAIDAPILEAVTAQTGVYAANALGANIVEMSSTEPHVRSVLTRVARDVGELETSVLDHDGTTYVTSVVQLGDSARSHRLVLARSTGAMQASLAPLGWLLLAVPLLVLIAVLFSISVFRRTP